MNFPATRNGCNKQVLRVPSFASLIHSNASLILTLS